jgi:hypothetical protein
MGKWWEKYTLDVKRSTRCKIGREFYRWSDVAVLLAKFVQSVNNCT